MRDAPDVAGYRFPTSRSLVNLNEAAADVTGMADFYQMLGLSQEASQDEIRITFRKLARQCHPDLNPNDRTAEQRFVAINEAHSTLADPKRRRRYDDLLRRGFAGPARAAARRAHGAAETDSPLFSQGSHAFQMGAFSDILWSPSAETA